MRVLGSRPFEMKENVKEYLQDMEDRNQHDKEVADAKAANTPVENSQENLPPKEEAPT